jgi:ABC-type multidrug transport system fused ATPase/permease subunit
MNAKARVPFKEYWQMTATYVRPEWRRVALLTALIFTTLGLQLVNPQIIRFFINSAQDGGATAPLIWAGVAFLGSALLLQVVQVSATYVGEDVGWRSTNTLRSDLALHCLQLDMSFHNDRTPGEMIERIDGDVANLAIFFAQFIIRVLGSLLLLAGVLLVLLFEDWRVSAAMTVYAIVTLTCFVLVRRIAVPQWKATREASADLFGFLEEQLAGTEDVRSSGASANTMRELYRYNQNRLGAEKRAGMVNSILVTQWFSLQTLGLIVALVSGYLLYRSGAVNIGTVYLIIAYANAIFWPLENLTDQIQNLQKAGASVERVYELYRTASKIRDGERTLPQRALGVQFDRVTFSYEAAHAKDGAAPVAGKAKGWQGDNVTEAEEVTGWQGDKVTEVVGEPDGLRMADPELTLAAQSHDAALSPPHPVTESPDLALLDANGLSPSTPKIVLDDLSFTLEPGEVLGLLGRTGSGKTTITRLLFRLYEPTGGAIRLGEGRDALDLRDVRLDDLRTKVGIVTQDVQIFRASVRDNLTFFDRTDLSDGEIVAVLEEIGLGPWFHALPNGLDTELESGGTGLSAGEAQLLAFTRVFLRNPGLVILDEASSRLDPATEQLIERAVEKLLRGRTAIIVAHRLHTVQRADKILILESGRIREFGAYAELAEDADSRFASLLQTGLEEVLA